MYIIAEIGMNHYDISKKEGISVFEAAKLCAKNAKIGGADAAKFQTYSAEKIVSKISPAYWDLSEESCDSQFKLFSKFNKFTQQNWIDLSNYCKEIGIDFMSTAFDSQSVDILSGLQKIWKISSSDITNFELLEKIAKQDGKIFLSTGASNIHDIKEAVKLISKHNNDIVIMHCILNYPTPNENANLNMIKDIKNNFSSYEIGYSDHTKPDDNMLITTAAYLLGAKYIEKHFTLDKSIPGNDHYHSMDVNDLKKLRSNLDLLKITLGSDKKICLESEKISQNNARRSIYTKMKLSKGDVLTEENIICKRPYIYGISSNKYFDIIGKKINRDTDDDYQIKLEDIE
jgi:N-acetylneuraminate synthase